jgi:hypothetical protein
MRRWLPYLVGLFFVGGLACSRDHTEETDDENFREEVIVCEEALAHIESCCPEIMPDTDACHYHHYKYDTVCGCDESGGRYRHEDVWPVMKLDHSRAVIATDCSALSCDEMKKVVTAEHSNYASSNDGCHNDADHY